MRLTATQSFDMTLQSPTHCLFLPMHAIAILLQSSFRKAFGCKPWMCPGLPNILEATATSASPWATPLHGPVPQFMCVTGIEHKVPKCQG
mmetsp:Transcript_65589/g.116755  ORF Transcript_65589/g.116755 Transcript_65589/m.116755 type:complete len:90 (+) Transcript_65589:155-424(+)